MMATDCCEVSTSRVDHVHKKVVLHARAWGKKVKKNVIEPRIVL